MTTYYIRYPRDFANEYTVYAVRDAADAIVLGLTPENRISRAMAIERGYSRPAEARISGRY